MALMLLRTLLTRQKVLGWFFIMVPDTPDVESVAAKIEPVANCDQLIIDMSTIAPTAERAIAARMRAKGAEYLDAPVSGGETGAIEGTLTIMVGGAVGCVRSRTPTIGSTR